MHVYNTELNEYKICLESSTISYLVVNGQHTVCVLIQFLHGQHAVVRRGDDIVLTGRINRCHKSVHFWEFIFEHL